MALPMLANNISLKNQCDICMHEIELIGTILSSLNLYFHFKAIIFRAPKRGYC